MNKKRLTELVSVAKEKGISKDYVKQIWNNEQPLLRNYEYEVEENEDGEVEEIYVKENIWNTLLFFLHLKEMRGIE